MSTSKESPKKLKTSNDWEKWIILARNVAGDAWMHINPEEVVQPIQVERPSFPRGTEVVQIVYTPQESTPQPTGANTSTSQDNIFEQPIGKKQQVINQVINPYELERYKDQLRRFEAMEKRLYEVRIWIGNNVAEEHICKLKDNYETVWELLRALKLRFKPTDRTRELLVSRRYAKAKRYNKDMKLDEWLDQYEAAFEEATNLGLPDVANDRPQYDFLLAIKPINPAFASSAMQRIDELTETAGEIPAFITYLTRFRNQYRMEESMGTRYQRAAMAVWSGMNESSDQGNVKGDGDKSRDKEARKGIKCLCGQSHPIEKCYNCNPRIRPDNWEVREPTKKRINEALQKSKKLRKRVTELGYEYFSENEGNTDSPALQIEGNSSVKGPNESYCSSCIGSGKNTDDECSNGTPEIATYSANTTATSKLRHQFTTDSASDLHIVNGYKSKSFTKTADAGINERINAGGSTFRVKCWGEVDVDVITDEGKRTFIRLTKVAFIPGFLTSIISLGLLAQKGTHWSTEQPDWLRSKRTGGKYRLKQIGHHWVIQNPYNDETSISDIEHDEESDPDLSAYAIKSETKKRVKKTAAEMHLILAHAGPEVIKHLTEATADIVIDHSDPCPTTTECDICGISKAKKVLSRNTEVEFQGNIDTPFSRIAWDLIPMSTAYNDHKWISHLWCRSTKYHIVETHRNKNEALEYLETMINYIENVLKGKVQFIRLDGERTLGAGFTAFCGGRGIRIERVGAPDAPEQNPAETGGRILTIKARTLRLAAGLPHELWPETYKATAYIENRTPIKALGYSTPFQEVTGKRPRMAYLRKFGCKAYALAKGVMKPPKLARLDPRANIGYLVGWDSTNIFRVWIPSKGQVIRTRDVTFSNDWYDPKDLDVGAIMPEEAEQVIDAIRIDEDEEVLEYSETQTFPITRPDLTQSRNIRESPINYERKSQPNRSGLNDDSDYKPGSETAEDEGSISESDVIHNSPRESSKSRDYPESQQEDDSEDNSSENIIPTGNAHGDTIMLDVPGRDFTSDSGLKRLRENDACESENDTIEITESSLENSKRLRTANYDPSMDEPSFGNFLNAFAASLAQDNNPKFHRDRLPEPPKSWKQVLMHPRSLQFIAAADREVKGLQGKEAIKFVARDSGNPEHSKLLPLKWVFTYKFDADGYLLKEKARLVARGDLQMTFDDTYSATLAAQSFRAVLAIMTYFNLESKQYDCHLAYLNAALKTPIYARCPNGYDSKDEVLKVLKALYGLKESGRLWNKLFTKTLEELGLEPVPGVSCLYTNGWMLLVFYVDDIFTVYPKHRQSEFMVFEKALLTRFTINYLGPGDHFLGIRIIRDRLNRTTNLVQDSYISKLASKYNVVIAARAPKSPLPAEPLVPNEKQATAPQIKGYQQKVGSLNYAAVFTRPDIAFAVSKLAQYLQNPSAEHITAADYCLKYTVHTKFLGLEFNGDNSTKEAFTSYSDAAYADDKIKRWSSFGFAFLLFGGLIHYKATKQKTVTTSSTEAEFLALAMTAREYLYWVRFFKNIHLDLQEECKIYCDNTSTIRLCTMESERLQTKLKHVDIHSCWLRQEVQRGTIKLQYIPTNDMVADGFTKQLTPQKHQAFIKQLNMVDVRGKIAPNTML